MFAKHYSCLRNIVHVRGTLFMFAEHYSCICETLLMFVMINKTAKFDKNSLHFRRPLFAFEEN